MSEKTLPRWKRIFGCCEVDTYWGGIHYDQRSIWRHVCYRIRSVAKDWPKSIRWLIAARLRRMASWVIGERWYVSDTWHGVPGNRAAELRQKIWETVVILWHSDESSKDELANIDENLSELAQAAGESWGHIWPKDEQ